MKQQIDLNGYTILVTGSPGFIGANLVIRLLNELKYGTIISLDNMNDYYEVSLKEYRLKLINETSQTSKVKHIFMRGSISDKSFIDEIFIKYKPDIVVNLAAQAGVRYSINHPNVYIETNIVGFYNILEACRKYPVKHLIYASSSSVYGENNKVPFKTSDNTNNPISLYAATKKSDEILAYSYSKLYNIPSTGLRFFTVYGPAGRPDMFYFSATKTLLSGGNIKLYINGDCIRDFTYIDDVVESLYLVIKSAPKNDNPPYSIYNVGGGNPVKVQDFITILSEQLIKAKMLPDDYDINAHCIFAKMHLGDVPITYADSKQFNSDYSFIPNTNICYGIKKFIDWYKEYYK